MASYQIEILDRLYEFDEPLLFVAKVGLMKSLFLKIDERGDSNVFLSCCIDDDCIEAIRDGRISIRGAFETQKDTHVVVSDFFYNVIHEEHSPFGQVHETILPEKGVGLFPRFGECPDALARPIGPIDSDATA